MLFSMRIWYLYQNSIFVTMLFSIVPMLILILHILEFSSADIDISSVNLIYAFIFSDWKWQLLPKITLSVENSTIY